MAFVPPVDPAVGGGFPVDGLGGLGLGAGLGKSLNVDISGGAGLGGLPFLGGLGLGGLGGGVPYVPVTPLGALEGFKGDLIVPIVIVGVAVFLLLLIVLAVKFAIAFKLSLLKGKEFRRDTTSGGSGGPPQEDDLNELAHIVLTAIQSQSCAQNVVCELGILARDRQGLPSLLRILSTLVPDSVQEPLNILRGAAEGSFKCDEKYACGTKVNGTSTPTAASSSPQAKPTKLNP